MAYSSQRHKELDATEAKAHTQIKCHLKKREKSILLICRPGLQKLTLSYYILISSTNICRKSFSSLVM